MGLQTNPLGIPPKERQNPLTYVLNLQRNLQNELFATFPSAAINAIEDIAVIAAFKGNQFGQEYTPDPDERADLSGAIGSYMNRAVYGSLTLGNVDPNINNGNQYTGIDGATYTFDNIVLPIALVTMNQPTNVVKTNITGAPGSVKEYIGLGDWDITINSIIIMPTDQSPIPFIQAFMRLKNAPVAIPVTNYFMNAAGITHIVIEDFNPVQEEGGYSKLAFTIKACSDLPLNEFLP